MPMNVIIYDSEAVHANMLPLSFTRPVSDFRVGITTIAEKWQAMLPGTYSVYTAPYLREKFVLQPQPDNCFVAANVLPTPAIADAVRALPVGHGLQLPDGEIVAYRGDMESFRALAFEGGQAPMVTFTGELPIVLHWLYDVFLNNGRAIIDDFRRLTAGRTSQPVDPTVTVLGPRTLPCGTPALFIEPGAEVEACTINLKAGPVYIGREAKILEGSCVRGPLALCDHAQVNMLAKIYADTTLGPYAKVGGELNNVVIFGYSNKAHDGYLGNAVIG